jgi:hypothetical protein
MGARYDQVEPHVGIVRAPLAANLTLSDGQSEFGPVGVSLNASGQVVVGAGGQSGFVGVIVKNLPVIPHGLATSSIVINNWMGARAGDIVDIMTLGQIVDVPDLAAGTRYYADATTGALTDDDDSGANPQVGFTVEATRLIVQPGVGFGPTVAALIAAATA